MSAPAAVDAAIDAWVQRQLANCPPLNSQQKALIRSAFAEDRTRKADAA
jgi:hypothetical protein